MILFLPTRICFPSHPTLSSKRACSLSLFLADTKEDSPRGLSNKPRFSKGDCSQGRERKREDLDERYKQGEELTCSFQCVERASSYLCKVLPSTPPVPTLKALPHNVLLSDMQIFFPNSHCKRHLTNRCLGVQSG